uniref:Uncharacterized protein n=1 Tax=Rhizophora mucronata TaxID=61149 RepID=A0A2P2PV75_RHIMU
MTRWLLACLLGRRYSPPSFPRCQANSTQVPPGMSIN